MCLRYAGLEAGGGGGGQRGMELVSCHLIFYQPVLKGGEVSLGSGLPSHFGE